MRPDQAVVGQAIFHNLTPSWGTCGRHCPLGSFTIRALSMSRPEATTTAPSRLRGEGATLTADVSLWC